MQDLISLGTFLLKTSIVVIAAVYLIAMFFREIRASSLTQKRILVQRYADAVRKLSEPLLHRSLAPSQWTARAKSEKRRKKKEAAQTQSPKERIWVLDFEGDVNASAVRDLKDEITALLQVAKPNDQVLVRLESGGGTVVGYGLGASHLERIRNAGMRLVTGVDKVAASGGYMMAAVGDEILAAPFAVIGSIGVIATVPNIRPLLDEKGVRVLEVTAGEYKRTITPFSDVTPERLGKLQDQLSEVHELFKSHVAARRPALDIDGIATGEYWYGTTAQTLGLVDQITTTDDWLLKRLESHDIFLVRTLRPGRKMMQTVERLAAKVGMTILGSRNLAEDPASFHRAEFKASDVR